MNSVTCSLLSCRCHCPGIAMFLAFFTAHTSPSCSYHDHRCLRVWPAFHCILFWISFSLISLGSRRNSRTAGTTAMLAGWSGTLTASADRHRLVEALCTTALTLWVWPSWLFEQVLAFAAASVDASFFSMGMRLRLRFSSLLAPAAALACMPVGLAGLWLYRLRFSPDR
jgi:hypothetical protein